MARLLTSSHDSEPIEFGAKAWCVQGITFNNTAAKFWSHLIDELLHDFSQCSRFILRAPSVLPLTSSMLYPELAIQEVIERMIKSNIQKDWQEILSETEIFGLPNSVIIHLFHGETDMGIKELSLESVDSEIFPFLLVWLLKWSEIATDLWQNDSIAGNFQAADLSRGWGYDLNFTIRHDHVHEGLYQRSIHLCFQRQLETHL